MTSTYPSSTTYFQTLYTYTDCVFIPINISYFIDEKSSICWGQIFISHDRIYEWWNQNLNQRIPASRPQAIFKAICTMVSFCRVCVLEYRHPLSGKACRNSNITNCLKFLDSKILKKNITAFYSSLVPPVEYAGSTKRWLEAKF